MKDKDPDLIGREFTTTTHLAAEARISRQKASITWCDLSWPKIISLHDVLEPLKQALLASRDVILSSQICGSKLPKVFTLGDGCWLPNFLLPATSRPPIWSSFRFFRAESKCHQNSHAFSKFPYNAPAKKASNNARKGGLSLRGVAFMTVLAVLAVLGSALPSFCLSYKIQCQETTVTVLTVLAVSPVVAVSVVTATPLKPNPPFLSSWKKPPIMPKRNEKLEKRTERCPEKFKALFRLPKSVSPALFTVSHPRFQTQLQPQLQTFSFSGPKKQPKHKVFGRDTPGISGTQTSGYPGEKLYASGLFLLS